MRREREGRRGGRGRKETREEKLEEGLGGGGGGSNNNFSFIPMRGLPLPQTLLESSLLL